MDPYRPGHYAQYRAPYERPPFTPPGGPFTYGQTSRVAGYTSGTPTQHTAHMAPRPGYGIPLGGISPMASSRDGDFNEHYIIKLNSYEPWSFKRRLELSNLS
ncbi:unnamed protein product [Rhizophagus irregularis]|uniref:Uncharacterized protein n=1 Tax=Rhizophagus irregularis TaxID=588596 RepID=A0A915ZEL7_9GLOM|nr:unnamed protein product [Rhizophagus irregularis]